MANEIYYSGLGDLTVAEVIRNELMLLLADRADLSAHPAIMQLVMTSVNENASSSNVALTDASATVTIARYALQREISGLAQITSSVGLRNLLRFLSDMVGGYRMAKTAAIATAASGFTSVKGTTGTAMTVETFLSARYALQQSNVNGPLVSILYPKQVTELQDSIASLGGARQYKEPTQDMIDRFGQGYQGSFAGVDIFASSKVPSANAGADSKGAMMGYGAIAQAFASPPPVPGAEGSIVVADGGQVAVEFERSASADLTTSWAARTSAPRRSRTRSAWPSCPAADRLGVGWGGPGPLQLGRLPGRPRLPSPRFSGETHAHHLAGSAAGYRHPPHLTGLRRKRRPPDGTVQRVHAPGAPVLLEHGWGGRPLPVP